MKKVGITCDGCHEEVIHEVEKDKMWQLHYYIIPYEALLFLCVNCHYQPGWFVKKEMVPLKKYKGTNCVNF